MKKTLIALSALILIIMMIGCKKNSPSAPSNNPASTPSTPPAETQTAAALLTAGPSAQATATALAKTQTAIATLWTATATVTITPTNTPIIIYAYIGGDDEADGMSPYANVYIYDQSYNQLSGGIVTIKNTSNSTKFSAPYNGNYYNVQNPVYIPGDNYEVDIYYGGVTYTASSAGPGHGQLDAAGGTVSWQYSGNNNSVNVDNPDGTLAFSQSDSGTSNTKKSVDISQVYAASGQYGQYSVNLNLENELYNYNNSVFAGAAANSYFYISYSVSWDVFAEPGTTVVGTPTPTATPVLIIYAYIEGDDQASGMQSTEYVNVNDNNNKPISTAFVTIKDTTAATQAGAPFSNGQYRVASPVYISGDNYEVDVYYGGVTYTATVTAPGPAQIDSTGNTVTWQNGGNDNYMYVHNPDNTQAFYQSTGGAAYKNSTINLSPVYQQSGQFGLYRINLNLNNYNDSFAGTSQNSQIFAQYSVTWYVSVQPGNSVVGTPTPTNTPAVLIYARLNGYTGSTDDYVNVYDGNGSVSITNAVVTLKNITASIAVSVPYNGNVYDTQSLAHIPGDKYEMDVYSGGVTYTAQIVAPGPAQIDTAGNIVSWSNGGTNNSVQVENPDNTQAFSQSDSGSANKDSSINISSVYPASGQYGVYWVSVNLENNLGNGNAFTGSSQNSFIYIQENLGWDVCVSAGSQVVGTPTPTP